MSDSAMGVGRKGTPVVRSTAVDQSQTVGAAKPAGTLAVDAGLGAGRPGVAVGTAGGPTLPAPKRLSGRELMAILTYLQNKISESRIKGTEDDIRARGKEKEKKNDEAIEKLKKLAHASPAAKIAMKVFAWIGVALSFVVAGVVGAVSGGAAAAPLLVLATASAALLIAQESGLTNKIMDAMGMDEKAKMGFGIALAAVMVVANVVGMVASGGASAVGGVAEVAEATTSAASEGVQAAGTLAEAGASVAEGAAELSGEAAEVTATLTEVGAGVAEAGADVAEGATEVAGETAELTQTLAEAGTGVAEAGADVAEGATEAAGETGELTETLAEVGADVSEAAAGAAGAGGKASADAAEESVEQASWAVRTLARKLGVSAERVMEGADKLRQAMKIASGVSQVGLGASTIASSATDFEAGNTRADTQRIKAEQAKLNELDEEDLRRLRQLIAMMTQNTTRLVQAMNEGHKAVLHSMRASV